MYLFIWWGQQVNVNSLRNYWQDGLEGFQQYNYNYNYHDNPYFTMYENTNGLAKDRIIGNLSATYDIGDDFKFMVRGGRDFFSEYRTIKEPIPRNVFLTDSSGKIKSTSRKPTWISC